MTGMRYLALAATTGLLAFSGSAIAQQAAQGEQPEVSQQCLTDLAQFARDLSQEQFWVTGWGYPSGYSWSVAQPGAGPVDPALVEADPAMATDPALTADATTGVDATSPYAVAGVVGSPRNELRVLYAAGQVLARLGRTEGCEYLLEEMRTLHGNYSAQLQEAGVDPAEVTSWRQERIALASSVDELPETMTLTVDYLQGTEVRNRDDEHLGSVTDVIFAREGGQIDYIVLARGGFLGIGEDTIPVPWERFSYAPGLNTLVLDVTEAQLDQAPTVSLGDSATADRYVGVDTYWNS